MSRHRRTVPDRGEAKSERFRHKQVQRLSSDQRRALEHGAARNGRVAEALCFMALIRDPARRVRPLLPVPNVSCTAAVRQFFRADDGEQAAHLLPGQISIDGAFAWLFLSGPAARRLENLFAYVEPLRADFNKADSAAEANGLSDAFADACRRVLTGRGEAAADIVAAYEQGWVSGALAAFAAAEAQKRSKPAPPPIVSGVGPEYGMILNIDERMEAFADDSIWATYEQLSILGYYKAAMEDAPPQLRPRAIGDILTLPQA
ncbi:hypothetical protein [Bosea sp. (in: a-proteobacteria)]|uniref:hypothetical protein n=1 Tax=Bosea sp. (in: a-proteobacteria) TaxID=1871050 RepID=UPI00261CC481|nr:hypothetical protein [Bosea sp. (in: a-proteobacteria)]MCO5093522.1 hypothetical protein [Bosea sp. (in: a-proteobacteria)]